MQINFKKITSAVTMSALLVSGATPMAMADITGNGAGSVNYVSSTSTNSTSTTQNNEASISYNISSTSSTGGNTANANTGGDVFMMTGNASNETDITTVANWNEAVVQNEGGSSVSSPSIVGNGAGSENTAITTSDNTTTVDQRNRADVSYNVDANARTGNNEANRNTGSTDPMVDDDVVVVTGHAANSTDLRTAVNVNRAMVSGGHSSSAAQADGGTISGNGAGSVNYLSTDYSNSVMLDQRNRADVSYDVESDAVTGNNEANANTGSELGIDTGNALNEVDVETWANYNFAVVSNDSDLMAVEGKIVGNGADSMNTFLHTHTDELENDQTNRFDAEEFSIDSDSRTGGNEANRNTAGSEDDPFIFTGHSASSVDLMTAVNTNLFGTGEDVEFDFDFDLESLFDFFM